jgi:hypothetical protein
MYSLRGRQLLFNAAKIYEKQRQAFNKPQILKKVNEIKYLSSQKKVPKLTLRKEILHLEHKLKAVLEVDRKLARRDTTEHKKIERLKKQVKGLREKIKATEDKDFSKKIEKLSYLIGDYLARKGSKEDIELCERILQEVNLERECKVPVNAEMIKKVKELQNRLNALKHEIDIHSELETKSPHEIKLIETQVVMIQNKLDEYYNTYPELLGIQELYHPTQPKLVEVKHNVLFEQKRLLSEGFEPLPLPPPPRLTS